MELERDRGARGPGKRPMPWRARCRAACVAVAAAGGVASAQGSPLLEVHFEPPRYSGSAQGEPLAGQDGWYDPRGGGGEWLVFTFEDNPLRLPPWRFARRQFAGVMARATEPAEIERQVELDTGAWALSVEMAVTFEGPLPAAGEIGRFSFEPSGESAGIAMVAQWHDGAGLWRASMLVYDALGMPQLVEVPGFEGLEAGRWYSWGALTDGQRVIDVWLRDWATGRARTFKPVDWYQGSGDLPDAVRLAARPAGASETGIGFDDVMIYTRGCGDRIDCDHSGQLDFFDFLCFQEAYVAGALYADFDGDGDLTFFDFLGFQDAFCCGCP